MAPSRRDNNIPGTYLAKDAVYLRPSEYSRIDTARRADRFVIASIPLRYRFDCNGLVIKASLSTLQRPQVFTRESDRGTTEAPRSRLR